MCRDMLRMHVYPSHENLIENVIVKVLVLETHYEIMEPL